MRKIKLLFFPFAGGNRYSYLGLERWIGKKNIQMLSSELPGRGERLNEPLLTNMYDLADDLFQRLQGQIEQPYALFGHSMGGLLAFLFAKKALACLKPPVHLFISGKGGPAATEDESSYLLPSAQFREKLRELGGTPEEALANETLMEFLEPIIRADFRAIQTYEHCQDEPIDIPITLMLGKEDYVTMEEALLWQKQTTRQLEVIEFTGNHFFIYDHLPAIADIIGRRLQSHPMNLIS
jgi:surfactin synthase thioesterase subunit